MADQAQARDTGVLEDGTLVELIGEPKSGWQEVRLEDGATRKVRPSAISEIPFTDETEDDDAPRRGDVFPAGIRETYERGKTEDGSVYIDSGDALAVQLRGAELETVAALAAKVIGERTAQGWIDLYTVDREEAGKARLNPGMIRMNLGNRIRAALKRQAEAEA